MIMPIFRRVLQFLLPVIIITVAVLVAMTMIWNQPYVETRLPTVVPPGVRVHLVTLETAQVSVRSQGTVRPKTETELVPQIAGRILWVSPSFVAGGFFEQDEILLRIDPFDYQQTVISVRSQLAQSRLRLAQEEAEAEVAQREWESLGRGNPRELTLRKPQLNEARASVAAAEASLLRAERDLERSEIRAPYAGRLRTKSVDVGQFVTVGAPIGSIYAIDIAEVRLPLPDGELAYLNLPLTYRGETTQPGPRVTLQAIFAGATYEWGGRVVRTESEIDPVSRMVHVVAEVRDPYAPGTDPNRPPLAVGMFVEAEISGRDYNNVAVIPRAALRGRNQVLIVDSENRMHFRDIDILRATNESLYVSGGLVDGELVAVSALNSPTDGMLVQVTDIGTHPSTNTISDQPKLPLETPTDESIVSGPQDAQPEQPGSLRERLVDSAAVLSTVTTAVRVGVFSNVSQMPVDTETSRTLREMVTTTLASLDSIQLVSTDIEATLAITGGIQRVGNMLRLTASLIDVRQGSVVHAVKVDGPADQGQRLQSEIVDELRNSLVDLATAPSTTGDDHLDQVETPGLLDSAAVLSTVTTAVRVGVFSNVSQMPVDTETSRTLREMVTTTLASLDSIQLVSTDIEATLAITGGIQRVGNMLRLTASLIDVRQGSVVHAVKVDGPADQGQRLQSEIVDELRNSLLEVTS